MKVKYSQHVDYIDIIDIYSVFIIFLNVSYFRNMSHTHEQNNIHDHKIVKSNKYNNYVTCVWTCGQNNKIQQM